jgi:2-keto-3-deoxy-L-rhamnonate aldolase RhmA
MTIPVTPCRVRETLAAGRLAVGTMLVELRQPSVMGLLAQAGLDFVILDNEHGPFSVETLADLSRAAVAAGVTPIVRPPEPTYAHITQPLDGGAQGIMLPRVRSRADVEACLAHMKYPPAGRRGAVLARGHTGFRGGPLEETLAALNRETFLVVQVETAEAVDHLDDILSVPGVDAALVGPTDLSVALGIPGRLDEPVLEQAITATMEACARHGVVPAIHTNVVEKTAARARRGMRMVSIGSEVGLLLAGAGTAVSRIRSPA